MLSKEEIIKKDFQVFVWRGLVYNGALLRTIIENQITIMKALKCVDSVLITQEINDFIKENYQKMEAAFDASSPLFSDVYPPIKDE